MKLSEAIRLGIGAVENDRTEYFVYRDQGPCGCAIGTALYAVSETHRIDDIYGHPTGSYRFGWQALEQVWPWTSRILSTGDSVSASISHRHSKGESRESIAAWIETIEPQDDQVHPQETVTESVAVHPLTNTWKVES